MRKFKFNRGKKEELKEEDISKYKDFGAFRTNYNEALKGVHRRPLYKNPKTFLMLLLIALVAWVVSQEEEVKEVPQGQKTEQDSITVAK